MDAIDSAILEQLRINSRMTSSDISKGVNLSLPAVTERIRKMEEAGIIEHFTIKLSREMLGYKLLAFVFVNLEKPLHIVNFRTTIVQCAAVLECHHVAGEYDYLLKILVKDTVELEDFLSHTLKEIAGVVKTNTILSLATLKETINP